MDLKPQLTEAALVQLFNAKTLKRAGNYLAAGKIVERTLYANGVIDAVWDTETWHGNPDAPEPCLYTAEGDVEVTCSCDTFLRLLSCDHSATLALAWLRQPETFKAIQQAFDLGTFEDGGLVDDYDEEDDDDLVGPGRTIDLNALLESMAGGSPFEMLGGLPAPRLQPQKPASASIRYTAQFTIELPDLRPGYEKILNELTVARLRNLARQRGVPISGTRREVILNQLAEALSRPGAVAEAWAALSPNAKLTLGLMLFLHTDYGVYRQQLEQSVKLFDSKVTAALEQSLAELDRAGLAIADRGNHLCPRDLSYHLPPDANFARLLLETKGLRIESSSGGFNAALFATQLLLAVKSDTSVLRARPAPTSHPILKQVPQFKGWPIPISELDSLAKERHAMQAAYTRRFTMLPAVSLLDDDSRKKLARALSVEPEQIDFGLYLLAKMGLLLLQPGQLPQLIDEGFKQFMSQPPLGRVLPLLNAWTHLQDWPEINLATGLGLKCSGALIAQNSYPNFVTDLALNRPTLLKLLRRAPAGQWIDLEQLVARAQALNVGRALWSLPAQQVTLETNGRVLDLAQANDWRSFFRAYLAAFLNGPLRWLGLVDLAFRKTELAAFRLTDLGAFALYQTTEYKPPAITRSGPTLKFLPDGNLSVRADEPDSELLTLLSVAASLHSVSQTDLTYAINPESAGRAFESGWGASRILAALEKAAGTRPPKPLAESLQTWWRNFGDVTLYKDIALVELADDYALTELLASTSLARHLLYRFSPRLIALRADSVEAWRAEMLAKGYTPKIEKS